MQAVHKMPNATSRNLRVHQLQSLKLSPAGLYKYATDAERNTTEENETLKKMTKMSFSSADYFFCKFTFHSYRRIQSRSVLTSWLRTVRMTSVLYGENIRSRVPQVNGRKRWWWDDGGDDDDEGMETNLRRRLEQQKCNSKSINTAVNSLETGLSYRLLMFRYTTGQIRWFIATFQSSGSRN